MPERKKPSALAIFKNFYEGYVDRLRRGKPHGAIDPAAAETVADRVKLAIDSGATTEQISEVIDRVRKEKLKPTIKLYKK